MKKMYNYIKKLLIKEEITFTKNGKDIYIYFLINKRKRGYIYATENNESINLDIIYVNEKNQNKKIGTSLLKRLKIHTFTSRKPIRLIVTPLSTSVNKRKLFLFYRYNGFKHVNGKLLQESRSEMIFRYTSLI